MKTIVNAGGVLLIGCLLALWLWNPQIPVSQLQPIQWFQKSTAWFNRSTCTARAFISDLFPSFFDKIALAIIATCCIAVIVIGVIPERWIVLFLDRKLSRQK